MEHGATLIAVIHIVIAFFLVVIVLLQDSKGGGVGGSFGGSNQSIFGATGAASFLVKVTRFLAVGFMVTCLILTVVSSKKGTRSVIDSMPLNATAPAAPAPAASAPSTTPDKK